MRTARSGRWLWAIAAPGLAGDNTPRVAEELAEDFARSYGAVGWRTVLEVDRLVEPPALTTDLIEAARRKLLERGWDLAVVVTDLPLKRNGRPVGGWPCGSPTCSSPRKARRSER